MLQSPENSSQRSLFIALRNHSDIDIDQQGIEQVDSSLFFSQQIEQKGPQPTLLQDVRDLLITRAVATAATAMHENDQAPLGLLLLEKTLQKHGINGYSDAHSSPPGCHCHHAPNMEAPIDPRQGSDWSVAIDNTKSRREPG